MIQYMILEVVQSKWSLTWYDPLGPQSTAQPPISFIVSLVLSATNSTLENQAVN